MRIGVLFGLLILICLPIASLQAQHKHKMRPFFKGRYNSIKVPRSKKKLICPGYNGAQYPVQSLGIKLGDPIAITYKVYMSKRLSIDLDYGRTATGLYSNFIKQNFEDARQDTLGVGEDVRYFGHNTNKDGIFTGKIIYSTPFKRIDGLHWYLGIGAQYRWSDFEYIFIQEIPNTANELKTFDLDYFTLGPSAVLGLEFMSPDIPLSSFFEVEGYYDAFTYPGWIRISAGVGIRYIF